MKFVKRSDIAVKAGYPLYLGSTVEIVGSNTADKQFKVLKDWWTKAKYIESQPDESAAPSLAGFESANTTEWFACDKAKQVIEAIFEEQAGIEQAAFEIKLADRCNKIAKKFSELIEFVASEEFVVYDDDLDFTLDEDLFKVGVNDVLEGIEFIVKQRMRMADGDAWFKGGELPFTPEYN